MSALISIGTYLLLCGLAVVLQPVSGLGHRGTSAAQTASQAVTERDGQHDFDFNFGTWKTHITRLQHPLSGSTTWVEYEGISVVRKVWDGRASLFELEAEGPAGHIEGVGLRLYNPQSHQWSLNWANGTMAVLTAPNIGEFKNGRGEFYGPDTLNGRAIYVRNGFYDITPDSSRFEQAFSDDGGKTWETNWIMTFTRTKDEPGIESRYEPPARSSGAPETNPQTAQRDGQHDFDFYFGTWKQHLKRLQHPLTGSTTWAEFDGTIVDRKVWGGRANLNEFEGEGPTGHIEGLTLRLYNPESHQWSLYWANSKDGVIGGPPNVGEFKNGRGEFYSQDTFNGRAIFIRYVWSDITANSAHFEQSYSDDGGQTWEANWISTMTRVQ